MKIHEVVVLFVSCLVIFFVIKQDYRDSKPVECVNSISKPESPKPIYID